MGDETTGERKDAKPADAMSEAAASALRTFRAAVAEVQRLSSAAEQEEGSAIDEEAMKSAKARLENAMKAATLAGVSESTLLEASAPEEAPEQPKVAEGDLKNGSKVEIHGLESEAGKQLNGQVGTITSFLEEKGRYQISLADKVVSIRPENLQLLPAASGGQKAPNQTGAESTFQVGDRVEVNGLESEAGRKLNERVGVTKEFLADKGRWTIEMEDTKEVVSVRPSNMSFVEKASEGSSSSSSSGSEKEQKPKKRKRSSANPEEALEAMLKGERVRSDKKKKSARDAGAAAAWAAQAHEADNGALKPGDVVEVHGLQSAGGKALKYEWFDNKVGRGQGPISSGAGHGKSAKSQARESEANRGQRSSSEASQ
ncbi:unnamed protein product [Cladocopium goreaui]|uniref:Uncharacterized protein n=1 Tax=Cladocopium goreaui TaxID=2562237 RepID=A0A9P1G767_9DINO|nr:unnamed protein product [Cladocopium goreaui]